MELKSLNKFGAGYRKFWVWFLLFDGLYQAISTLLYKFKVTVDPSFPSVETIGGMKVYPLTLVYIVVSRCALYYFSYKKRGTKLLTIAIWSFWINLIFQLKLGVLPFYSKNIWTAIDVNVALVLSAIWCFLCYKLRKLNRISKQAESSLKIN